MSRTTAGLLAGLAATIVISVLMVMKAQMGVMPELDVATMIAGVLGAPDAPLVGWTVHLLIGIVGYGLAMSAVGARLPGHSDVGHGLMLAIAGWFVMMVALMPAAGVGLFGITMGPKAPLMALALHLVFGVVLGATYGRLLASGGGFGDGARYGDAHHQH